jgi:hypothetical protein
VIIHDVKSWHLYSFVWLFCDLALAERMNWLKAPLDTDPFGSLIAAPAASIKEWCLDPQVGGKGVFDTLEDTDSPECLKRLEDLQKISRDSAAAPVGSAAAPVRGSESKSHAASQPDEGAMKQKQQVHSFELARLIVYFADYNSEGETISFNDLFFIDFGVFLEAWTYEFCVRFY